MPVPCADSPSGPVPWAAAAPRSPVAEPGPRDRRLPPAGAADRRCARSGRLQLPRQAAPVGPLLQVPRPGRSRSARAACASTCRHRRWPTLRVGPRAVVPGSTSKSELVRRITSTDPKVMMPAPDSHLALDEVEKATLIRWIEQGAEWKPHWAFIPPATPALPAVATSGWARGEIDRFVLAALEAQGLDAVARGAARDAGCGASRFDLTGLPPTPPRSTPSSPTARPTPTSASSIACSPRRPTASAWPPTGSTSRATPTRTATRTTACARCGRGATG